MSRRSVASLLAAGLLIVFLVAAARMPVPYVTVSPGPTVDVLGKNGERQIVQVDGHRTYPTDGEIRLVTVSVTNPDREMSLVQALSAWLRKDVAVLPYKAMYPEPATAEQERAESAAQMVNSQDTAVAAALSELGYRLKDFAEVTGVNPGGPSDDKLKPRDRILTIEGARMRSVQDVFDALGKVEPGTPVDVGVRRAGKPVQVTVRTISSDDDPKRALLGILVGTGYVFPFDVHVGIDDSIGGPSAGLMFALSVFDTLTPGALTDGHVVAGTGTIAADGTVGPIGGIQQKIVGAERSGATLFFVPPDNCAEAVLAPTEDIRLVRADTLHSAVESLQKYDADPSADLPRCPT